jgi:hypothetical protein
LPTNTAWGDQVGILRVDLIPVNSYQRQDLANNGYSFVLYPTRNAAGGLTFGALNVPGQIHKAGTGLIRCNDALLPALRCRATVTLFGSTSGNYMMRLQAFYRPIQVEVNGVKTAAAGPDLELINGQAVVDSTGKVSDVLRRIQVRLPLTPNIGLTPSFGLESADSICKRLVLEPTARIDGREGAPTTPGSACHTGL